MVRNLLDSLLNDMHIRRKPHIIQMPITSRCNSRCITCNVWKESKKEDIDAKALKKILADIYFSKVYGVGLNGGELTLVQNLPEILEALFSLKHLRAIYIISNGLLPERLLEILKYIKKTCSKHNIYLEFTLSVDGVNETHEHIRGISGCFKQTLHLLNEISKDTKLYCDQMTIGCTISKYNIPYIRETEVFFSQYNFPVEYHLAIPNKRIHTFEKHEYYVLNDEHSRLLCLEFFYGKYNNASSMSMKFRYFCIYYFLLHKGRGRLANCNYQYRDITINETLNIYLCATASDAIGNLNLGTMSSFIKSGEVSKEENNTKKYCNECIHYIYTPTIKGLFIFISYYLSEQFSWRKKFKWLIQWKIY